MTTASSDFARPTRAEREVLTSGSVPVTLTSPTEGDGLRPVKSLLSLIRNRSKAISFDRYKSFMDRVMGCEEEKKGSESVELQDKETQEDLQTKWREQVFRSTDAYEVLKESTEAFLKQECGVLISEWELPQGEAKEEKKRLPQLKGDTSKEVKDEIKKNRDDYLVQLEGESIKVLPYFKRIADSLKGIPLKAPDVKPPNCYGILRSNITEPCLIELIWSYWHEEGMLVQSMNAISLRFQNRRALGGRDPLGELELDPLRPLNNILWGYIQDEQHRLTLIRRAYEYDHHYGFRLYGKALSDMNPADSRSKFLEAFHHLLHLGHIFYKEASDMTIKPDGYPILNALKEVHLLLAQGMHNQYGDLPWTARVEMLMQQWVLARPEFREFLRGRPMVPYPEPWMEKVDAMKKLQGWTDVTVRHFRDLAMFGEQILLSVRFGDWSNVNDELDARIWAQYLKEEIMGYIHAYRAVTGVDLTEDAVDSTLPSIHLRNRLAAQRR